MVSTLGAVLSNTVLLAGGVEHEHLDREVGIDVVLAHEGDHLPLELSLHDLHELVAHQLLLATSSFSCSSCTAAERSFWVSRRFPADRAWDALPFASSAEWNRESERRRRSPNGSVRFRLLHWAPENRSRIFRNRSRTEVCGKSSNSCPVVAAE
jgi:hypothetical protein